MAKKPKPGAGIAGTPAVASNTAPVAPAPGTSTAHTVADVAGAPAEALNTAPVAPAPGASTAHSAATLPKGGSTEMRDAVFVKSVSISTRRCGYRFDRDGFGIELSQLSEEQIEQMENDPDLIVERCQFPMSVDV